jgi:hypothetical protein
VTEETSTLVRYRLSRAEVALEEAVLLLDSDHTILLSTGSTMPVSMLCQPYCWRRAFRQQDIVESGYSSIRTS